MATMIGLFDKFDQAQKLVTELVGAGIARDAISLVSRGGDDAQAKSGVVGMLSDVGTYTVPGIGHLTAAGPLAASLGSQGLGALDTLVGLGVSEEQAHAIAEGVRRGATLVAVDADNLPVVMVEDFLAGNGAIDLDSRGASWREQGWQRFDPSGEAYTPGQSDDLGGDAPQEPEPAPEENLDTSLGALSAGMMPGGYGAVADEIFDLPKDEQRK